MKKIIGMIVMVWMVCLNACLVLADIAPEPEEIPTSGNFPWLIGIIAIVLIAVAIGIIIKIKKK